MRPRRIIVNADDFGMDAETNRAILDAFQRGVISSTTIMANMPGFEEACGMASRYRLSGKIGVHLNLTEGSPLSQAIRRLPRFCDAQGMFHPRRTLWRLSKQEMRAVEAEFAAQIQAVIDRGIVPTHLDSHHHAHTEWPIGAAAIRVARRFGIGAIRLSRNCGPGISVARRLYKGAYNARLRIQGLAKTRYFGGPTDVPAVLATTSEDVEVMVHLSREAGIVPGVGDVARIERWVTQEQLVSYA